MPKKVTESRKTNKRLYNDKVTLIFHASSVKEIGTASAKAPMAI